MKKRFKSIGLLLMVFMLLVSNFSFVYATDDEITPYWNNVNMHEFSFQVLSPGEAHISIYYVAKSGVFVQAKSTVKIQKKILGLFWTTVDIGTTNNEWVEYCTDVEGDLYNYYPVDGTGTYRAVFKLEITGIDGSVDVLEDTIEYKYS